MKKIPRYDNTNEELLAIAESGRYVARDSGAEFPPGIKTRRGGCEICTRENTQVAEVHVVCEIPGIPGYTANMCSECFADAVAATLFLATKVMMQDREFSAYTD